MAQLFHLLDYDLEGLEALFETFGERPFRARQVMHWMYRRGATGFDEMTDLSASFRERLKGCATVGIPTTVAEQVSVDGTRKLLLELADGERVETVLIPDADRITQCVSSQVGCAMGCAFCRTAELGLSRHLGAGEIVGQVLAGQRAAGTRVTNVVFMGMGEPLHNRGNVVRAVGVLRSDHGLNITKRRLTISTSGLVDEIRKLPADLLPGLAVSLNATTDEQRDRLMPVNRRYPIAVLLGALKELPLPPRGRFTIEYVLLGGVNDTLDDARRLVRLLSDVRCKVNLIAYNAHGEHGYSAPTAEAVQAFQTYLLDRNFTAMLRKSRGQDIFAACGQLAGSERPDPKVRGATCRDQGATPVPDT